MPETSRMKKEVDKPYKGTRRVERRVADVQEKVEDTYFHKPREQGTEKAQPGFTWSGRAKIF